MLLSVIVPVYNVEQYLERCLNSLLDQGDFTDYEIILVDDGSTDNSLKICKEYTRRSSIVKVYQKSNGGAASARNYGIMKAKGQYIMFVDSDDHIKADSLSCIAKQARDNHLDILSFNFIYSYDGIIKENDCFIPSFFETVSGQEYMTRYLKHNKMLMTVWKHMYSREMILDNQILFVEGIMYEDEEWMPRVFYYSKRVKQIDNIIYCYCIRQDSISYDTKRNRSGSLDLLKNCFAIKSFAKTIVNYELKNQLENHIVTLSLSAFYRGNLLEKAEIIKELLSGLYTEGKNTYKVHLFLFSPKLYYAINSTIKWIKNNDV